ncbi:MAG TPA: MoaD/ThiS family protein [Gemmatimonadaceae bacterium]|nr:MoaD/ThiS family protein [Gemmatimonadaceae bacterium]
MSTVTVQLFASYAETFGGSTLEIPLAAGSTVGDLVLSIRSLPGAYALPESLRVAVNRKFASLDQVVDSRDEVALIPPVAGG